MHLKQRILIILASVSLLACACALELSVNSSPRIIPVEAEHALLTSPYGQYDQINKYTPHSALVQTQNGLLAPVDQLWLI